MIPSGGRPEQQPDDPLLESLLDEVLGGQTPPDLRARILAHHEAAGGESLAAAWPGQDPVILAPPVQESPRMPPSLGEDQRARRRHSRALTVRRVIVALLTASAVLALVVFRPFFRSESAHRAGEARLAQARHHATQPPPEPRAAVAADDAPVSVCGGVIRRGGRHRCGRARLADRSTLHDDARPADRERSRAALHGRAATATAIAIDRGTDRSAVAARVATGTRGAVATRPGRRMVPARLSASLGASTE